MATEQVDGHAPPRGYLRLAALARKKSFWHKAQQTTPLLFGFLLLTHTASSGSNGFQPGCWVAFFVQQHLGEPVSFLSFLSFFSSCLGQKCCAHHRGRVGTQGATRFGADRCSVQPPPGRTSCPVQSDQTSGLRCPSALQIRSPSPSSPEMNMSTSTCKRFTPCAWSTVCCCHVHAIQAHHGFIISFVFVFLILSKTPNLTKTVGYALKSFDGKYKKTCPSFLSFLSFLFFLSCAALQMTQATSLKSGHQPEMQAQPPAEVAT